MSRDQRPGKIKIVSSGIPARRKGDVADVVQDDQAAAMELADPAIGESSTGGSIMLPALLYLAGCLLGGAGLTALHHFAG